MRRAGLAGSVRRVRGAICVCGGHYRGRELSNAPLRQNSRQRYERRRREIADIAAQVFAERGYHDASIGDLVAATGLQRGGLYHYISGKEELLVLIHQRFMEPLLEQTRTALEANEPPDVMLRRLTHLLLRSVEQHQAQVTVFLREWRNIKDSQAWEGVIAARREYEEMLLKVLRRGTDEGIFSISDHKMAAMSLLGMINYTYQWFDPAGRIGVEELADQMSDIFLDGIRSA